VRPPSWSVLRLDAGVHRESGGPIAILLQGQAWRWVWVTSFCERATLGADLAGDVALPWIRFALRSPGYLRMDVLRGRRHICLGLALLLWLIRDFMNESGSEVSSAEWDTIGILSPRRSPRPHSGMIGGRSFVRSDGGSHYACLFSLPRALRDGTRVRRRRRDRRLRRIGGAPSADAEFS